MRDEALKLALERVANALPAYIEGTPAREYLDVIHSALAAPVQEPVRLQCVHCGTVYADGVPPAVPAPVPLTLGQKQRLWSSVGDKPTLKDRVNAYGFAIEAAHGITKGQP